MKSRQPTRGYLSQVAEPVLPGQRPVTPRRTHPESALPQFEIPVVEETVEFVRQPSSPARPQVLDVRRAEPAGPAVAGEHTAVPGIAGLRHAIPLQGAPVTTQIDNERMVVHSAVQKSQPGTPKSEPPQPSQAQVFQGDVKAGAPRRSTELSKVVPRAADVEAVSPTAMEVSAPRLSPESSAQPNPARSPISAAAPQTRSHSMQQLAMPELSRNTAGEAKTNQRARVHIGTIEIRATPAQAPAPQPAAAVAATPTQNHAQRAPSTNAAGESLSRGLAWTFGLVQG